MEKRIEALERKYAAAIARIEDLEKIIFGNQHTGKITMREAREACIRGDKETVKRFNDQWVKEMMEKEGKQDVIFF